MRTRFMSAYQQGVSFVATRATNYRNIEDLIFVAYEQNPFNGEKSKKDFMRGVATQVNSIGARRNKKMNEKGITHE